MTWIYEEVDFLDRKSLLVEEARTQLALGKPADVEALIAALAETVEYAADLEQQIKDEELFGGDEDEPTVKEKS
jgi:hypothetical protein